MATIQELVKENNGGFLGRSLAEHFRGELGYTPPRSDSDFMVTFPCLDLVPHIGTIAAYVEDAYTQFGCEFRLKDRFYDGGLEAFVSITGCNVRMYLQITTRMLVTNTRWGMLVKTEFLDV